MKYLKFAFLGALAGFTYSYSSFFLLTKHGHSNPLLILTFIIAGFMFGLSYSSFDNLLCKKSKRHKNKITSLLCKINVGIISGFVTGIFILLIGFLMYEITAKWEVMSHYLLFVLGLAILGGLIGIFATPTIIYRYDLEKDYWFNKNIDSKINKLISFLSILFTILLLLVLIFLVTQTKTSVTHYPV